jgi:hypothetical protein
MPGSNAPRRRPGDGADITTTPPIAAGADPERTRRAQHARRPATADRGTQVLTHRSAGPLRRAPGYIRRFDMEAGRRRRAAGAVNLALTRGRGARCIDPRNDPRAFLWELSRFDSLSWRLLAKPPLVYVARSSSTNGRYAPLVQMEKSESCRAMKIFRSSEFSASCTLW